MGISNLDLGISILWGGAWLFLEWLGLPFIAVRDFCGQSLVVGGPQGWGLGHLCHEGLLDIFGVNSGI